MKIAVVGAGVAGLTTAKVLTEAGHETEVFDKAPDVGGVWSRTRRYPGLTTQSPKAQYSFSDHQMPKNFPEWPTGAQVQQYLESYVAAKGLEPTLRLRTTVISATPLSGGGWQLRARNPKVGKAHERWSTTDSWSPTVSSASPRYLRITGWRISRPPEASCSQAPSCTTRSRHVASTY